MSPTTQVERHIWRMTTQSGEPKGYVTNDFENFPTLKQARQHRDVLENKERSA